MQLEELKLVAAGNIINLRTAAGLTQAFGGFLSPISFPAGKKPDRRRQ